MRILHLPKWYPHRYDDQDGDFVARHVAAIARQPGIESAVVFAAVARGPVAGWLAEDHDLGGPVPTWRYYYRARPSGWAPLDKLLKLGLWLLAMGRGRRAVRRHWGGAAPDVVHAHILFRTALLARWLRGRHGWPYLITENWTIFQPANAWRLGLVRRWLAGWLVRGAAAYTPVSHDLRRALAALGGVNAHTVVIPNVVDTDLFYLPADPRARTGLLNVAAFNEPAKNLSGLLRTVAHLRAVRPTLPGLHLRIAGYGPAEAAMHQLAAELGLLADGTVEFLGKLTPAQVADEMRRAAVFVLFSNYENLPCVLIEAQASGLPAVATRVSGVPELLPDDGTLGLLVPARDEAALAAALTQALAAPARFSAAAMRSRAVAKFSYPAVGAAFQAVYLRMLTS
ncbi:glycosyltransferase family 4 protein [Hymenobacter sp. RP-2-7]|uniref:Glycosyltransferase family 4 protein n=1 Tax=Hymenobacter polaris TaxID=2682546 RepID=A0A7Y0AFR8_9BACT|nr:glycosyltransferase [Hymenobacter polaris]NML66502.1 glycosyltransferase family 4 protein [Hymenobacter polaris]